MAHTDQLLLIGAHTSAAGGVHMALLHGKKIGANAIQLFTANQKTWNAKPLTSEAINLWETARAECGIEKIMSHDSYLINLGSPNPEILTKSRKLFAEELTRCQQLKIDYLNFHPGAATSGTHKQCLDTIVESLLLVANQAKQGPTRLLLETTAGQGTSVGWNFDDIGYIMNKTSPYLPIGVCIDTCHSFCAGYDLCSLEGWENTLANFDKSVGLKHLYALHINDSLKPFASRRDRHASLGEGEIGMECFKICATHPILSQLMMILETPNPDRWSEEISLLRQFAKEKRDAKM